MVKGIYQLPPCTRMELLHSNVWLFEGLDLINQGFTSCKGLNLYRKGIQFVDDVWDSETRDFLTWGAAFELTLTKMGDWDLFINKLSGKWRQLLENDTVTTHAGQWLGFYVAGGEDPAFVLQCTQDFSPQCMHYQHLSMPLQVQCYTMGTHSRCLSLWEKPIGEMEGLFHEVKFIHTTRGQKKEGEIEKIIFFYGKTSTLRWDPVRWRWVEGGHFLNYTIKLGRDFITKRTEGVNHAADKWQGYLPGNYKF